MNNAKTSEARIVIYTHPDCTYSSAAKDDFKKRGIAFLEIDVTKVLNAIQELERLTDGEHITPVIIEGEKITVGYYGVG